ncbi:GMC oxidoreductase [Phellopilus nigrolimitatus]|nr:GMC oxidoreductase [Phellopilus nigrolimitatus]
MSATVEEITSKAFDYVVIGGGTAGLTVAARLAEDPSITVAVLEAGLERLDDPVINIPGQFGKHFGDPKYDWDFHTVPQEHANGREVPWPRGKVLGGSSAINFYVWDHPPKQDIDAWEKLGNPGWNWERFSKSLKKTEGFTPPTDENAARYKQVFNPDAHGTSGPLKTSFPGFVMAGDVPFQETVLNSGVKIAKDPMNGDPIGTWMAPVTLDETTHKRSYAATAFYQPNANKPNFRVLCGALVHRIATTGSDDDTVEAKAVEFEHGGVIYTVSVKKEVVVSAGSLKSPQILELSGIGDKRVLGPLGIQTVIDLPGVGSNMQEHIYSSVIFELDPELGHETLDRLADNDYVTAQLALHAVGKGFLRIGLSGFTFLPFSTITSPERAREFVGRQRQRIEERQKSGSLPPGLKEQYELQLGKFERDEGGECELICFPGYLGMGAPGAGKPYMSILLSFNHLFGRGTVHATSTDPHVQPDIDPHYFEEKLDLDVMVETVKFMRRLAELEPFKSFFVKEVTPGPACTTDKEIEDFVKNSLKTTYHTTSTLSMLPRELNGAVDPNLRMYGTKNIRVADLSIVPLHVAAHTQSTAYAIGEQAADIILGRIPPVK